MRQIPRDKSPDSSLAYYLDPYRFVSRRCRRYNSDLFQTRLLLRETICVTGPELAKVFYNPERFSREGAMPGRIQKTLFGEGGVQGLDDGAHLHRKKMFMSLMSREQIVRLASLVQNYLEAYVARWRSQETVVLYFEMQEILTQAVCEWTGVPLAQNEVRRRSSELSALFDDAGDIGPKYWWAR